jgi:hypothetical protein
MKNFVARTHFGKPLVAPSFNRSLRSSRRRIAGLPDPNDRFHQQIAKALIRDTTGLLDATRLERVLGPLQK